MALARASTPSQDSPVDAPVKIPTWKGFPLACSASAIFASSAVKPKKKKEEVSVAASIANSAAQDERNSRQGAHYNTSHDSHDNKEDFTIHSAEEARRAIIWGEILQRKYWQVSGVKY